MSDDLLALDRPAHNRTRHLVAGSRPTASAVDDTVRMERVGSGSTDRADGMHWPALDGLRGIAVAGVVAYHLGWISGGFLGVDLFFALSGFLITTLLVREHRTRGRIDLLAFWSRRFRRLLPAVMVLIAGVLAWCTVFGTPAEQAGARGDSRWAIPYLANWHLVSAARDYWASATDASVFTHLWSLAIEEQFYVVWPVVAWWALRGHDGERRLARLAAIGFVASVVAMVVLYDASSPNRVYLGTDTRAAALLIGALVALNPLHRVFRAAIIWRSARVEVVALMIAALLGGSWLIGGDHLDLLLSGGLVVHSVLAAFLVGIIAVTSGTGGRAARWLDRPWLTWLGQRSYGIYLWHWPVIVLAEPRWNDLPAPARDMAMIALSLGLAEASFHLLEHPVRRRVGWAVGNRAMWATVTVTAIATAIAIASPSGRGHVADFELASVAAPVVTAAPRPVDEADALASPQVNVVSDGPARSTFDSAAAGADENQVERPLLGRAVITGAGAATGLAPPIGAAEAIAPFPATASAATPAPPTLPRHVVSRVLWVGDSVAADLAPALIPAFGASGVTWIDGTGDGLRLTPGGGVDPVEVYSKMFDAQTFDTVVVQLSYWDSPADIDQLRISLGWFRDQVRARDAELVVLTPPPIRDDLVDPGLARQIEVVNELVAGGEGHVHLVDTLVAWGPTMAFDIDGDGAPDRKPDGVHVCPQGAARFAVWLTADLASRFDGVALQPADVWGAGDWSTSRRYDTPAGACVALG